MSLKDEYLFLAIACLFSVYLSGYYLLLYCIGCIVLFCYRNKTKRVLFIVCFILFQCIPTTTVSSEVQYVLEINDIKTNYVVASNGDFKCILYNIEDVNFNDVIEVSGEVYEISSNQNFNLFDFKQYMEYQGISQSIYVTSYEVIEYSSSMKSKVYTYLNNHALNTIYLAYFYGIDEDDNLIVTSGYHFMLFITMLTSILKTKRQYVTIGFCMLFMILFPIKTSILRMFIFALVQCVVSTHKYDKLGISILCMLCLNKYYVYEIGFMLPVIFSFTFLFNVQRIPRGILTFFIVTGIQLLYFYEANLFVILCFPFLRYCSGVLFILVLFSLFIPFLSSFILLFISFIQFIQLIQLPFSTIIGNLTMLSMIAYPYCIFMLMSTSKHKYYVYLCLLLCYQANIKLFTPYGEVSVLDIGQGDCILIREPFNGDVMLIDTGGNIYYDVAENIVYPILKSKGIKSIDVILITHDDYDHCGALESLQQLIEVKEVITEKQDIELSNLYFSAYKYEDSEETNDLSIILYSEINGLRYLFTGDAPSEVEKDFIKQYNELTVDVLKVGHHGSNTSSCSEFLESIRPLYAFISSGKNNSYNHPSDEVIERLLSYGIDIYDTQDVGNISIIYTPFFNLLHTGNKTFGIIGWVI